MIQTASASGKVNAVFQAKNTGELESEFLHHMGQAKQLISISTCPVFMVILIRPP